MKKTVTFIRNNINATLLVVIIGLLSYINMQNQKAMDKLIVNTTLLKENDIKQDLMIVLNKEDIEVLESDVKKLQTKYYNNKQYLTSKK